MRFERGCHIIVKKVRLLHIRLAVVCPKNQAIKFTDECDSCDFFEGATKYKGQPKIRCSHKKEGGKKDE